MTLSDIASQRLRNQRLTSAPFETAEDVVRHLGAMQSQDYAGAKWAIAQRMSGVTDAELDQVFAEGKILRTHVMRPTWHFVLPEDIRWLLELTAPRVKAFNAYYYRQWELDDDTFRRSQDVLVTALQGGNQLTRTELAAVLEKNGITASGMRLGGLMMQAELDAVICSGARRGKQFTYALLDERAPNAKRLERDEALAELARRYFTSHGPALLPDYVWWSGLSTAEAKMGLEFAKPHLTSETIDGKTYWFGSVSIPVRENPPLVHLLPNYDECVIAYKNHSGTLHPAYSADPVLLNSELAGHILVVGGQVQGGWRRTFEKKEVVLAVRSANPLSEIEQVALQANAEQFGLFLGIPVRHSVEHHA